MVYPIIAENFPLESRLAEEGEGVPIIRHRSCKERFIRNSKKMILIWIYKLGDNNIDLALGPSLIVRGE
jgi:hypothetical protein